MSGRERVEECEEPRRAAIDFVTGGGQNTLKVERWIDASRPSGQDPEYSYSTGVFEKEPAKKGIQGRVVETGQTFTVRDDFDFAKPKGGKGYHVNVQLGKETVAFCKTGSSFPDEYHDRVKMTGERYYNDGPDQAAKWYTNRDTTSG